MPASHHSLFTGQMTSCHPTNSVNVLDSKKADKKFAAAFRATNLV